MTLTHNIIIDSHMCYSTNYLGSLKLCNKLHYDDEQYKKSKWLELNNLMIDY